MANSICYIASLYAFWLLLSGTYTPFLLTVGAACTIVIFLLAQRMDLIDKDEVPVSIAWTVLIRYYPWLAKEIFIAAIRVCRVILSPSLPISPQLVEFSPSQRSNIGLITHANSITLTPGTITVEVEMGRLLIHALTMEGASGLDESEMDQRCSELEEWRKT